MTQQRFVILAAPRTGSNWLCTLLNTHPQVLCHHELFNPEGPHFALDKRGVMSVDLFPDRLLQPHAFLEQIWQQHHGAEAVGFKLNRGQPQEVFAAVLADQTILKIVLQRRNRIKTYVSECIAQLTGRWESYKGSYKPAAVQVSVQAQDLDKHIRTNDAYFEGLRQQMGSAPCLQLYYEDIGHSHEQLLSFLGLHTGGASLQAGSLKQNSRDLRDTILNFEELRQTLSPGLTAELLDQNT